MHKTFRMAMLASLTAIGSIASSNLATAATGTTDVTINFPNIVILHYPKTITLTFTGSDVSDFVIGAADTKPLLNTVTFDADITATTVGTGLSTVAVTLKNAYAVRGISSTGNITVGVTLNPASANATGANGSKAIASGISVSNASISAPGLTTAIPGDVSFDLDISGVTDSGAHTGMQYTVTATAP